MAKVLVSGLINIETTLSVDEFPVHYMPVRYAFFGINSTVSGVGYNVTKALTTLGDQVHFTSLVGCDLAGKQVYQALKDSGLPSEHVLVAGEQTAQSVILYDQSGRRQINVDLKDIQGKSYPAETFDAALPGCELAVLCNINFSRSLLARARQAGKWIATDVHAISNLDDTYNVDFMAAADILFMSDEALPEPPRSFARRVLDRFANEILVIGLGAQGALLAVKRDDFIDCFPAVYTRPVVNTIGAGDALFSSFVHEYVKSRDPYRALQRALVFASYKIGVAGAADGFLSESQLDEFIGTDNL